MQVPSFFFGLWTFWVVLELELSGALIYVYIWDVEWGWIQFCESSWFSDLDWLSLVDSDLVWSFVDSFGFDLFCSNLISWETKTKEEN